MKGVFLCNGRGAVLLLIGMMVMTFFIRFSMLQKSDYAPGLDGYSYAVQTYSIKHFNRVKDPDSSPVFWFLGGLAKVLGDPVRSNKAGAAILAALLLVPAFLLLREWSGRAGPGLLAAGLCAVSPSLIWLSVEFLKNLGALSGLMFFLFLLLRSSRRGFRPSRIAGLVLLFVFCFFAHRTTAVLAAVTAGVFFLPDLWKRKRLLFLLPAGGAALLFVFTLIRGGLHFLDLERFSGVFSFGPFLPVFSAHFRSVLPPVMVAEMTLVVLSPFLLLFFRTTLLKDRFLRTVWAVLFLTAMPFWNLSRMDMGFRLILLAAPLAVIPAAALLSRIRISRRVFPAAAAAVVLLLLVGRTVYSPSRDPDYAFYEKVVAPLHLDEDSLLISHQGMNFYYTYAKWAGRKWEGSLCYIPEYKMPVEKLWRLAHGVTWPEMSRRYPRWTKKKLVKKLLYPYLLIREDCWRRFLRDQPKQRVRSLENWYNPHTVRPAFLRVHQKLPGGF